MDEGADGNMSSVEAPGLCQGSPSFLGRGKIGNLPWEAGGSLVGKEASFPSLGYVCDVCIYRLPAAAFPAGEALFSLSSLTSRCLLP